MEIDVDREGMGGAGPRGFPALIIQKITVKLNVIKSDNKNGYYKDNYYIGFLNHVKLKFGTYFHLDSVF